MTMLTRKDEVQHQHDNHAGTQGVSENLLVTLTSAPKFDSPSLLVGEGVGGWGV